MKQLGTLAIAGCAVIVAPALFACIGLVAGVQLQRALIRSSFAMVSGGKWVARTANAPRVR